MTLLSPGAAALVQLMGETPRGPRREGLFALWLALRVLEDIHRGPPAPERAVKRRVAALGQRLTSLSLPAPIRRALLAAVSGLEEPTRERAALLLQQLVAPAREALGGEAADAIQRAARAAVAPAREP